MNSSSVNRVRILFFSDSHLGFDNGVRARIQRRRRNDDFEKNFQILLNRALCGDIDCVVHGGDVFYRSRVMPELVSRCFSGLATLTENNIPVFVVPGNHERARIPHPLLTLSSGVTVFTHPRSIYVEKNGIRVLLTGFPYNSQIRSEFKECYERAVQNAQPGDFRLLCIHQAVEGARAGIQNYVFRNGEDVLPARVLPAEIDLVLAGHIHKAQILKILRDKELTGFLPVIYAGSIERTSFAEREEVKGYYLIDLTCDPMQGKQMHWAFERLPVRPMFVHVADSLPSKAESVSEWLKHEIGGYPADSVIHLSIRFKHGEVPGFVPGIRMIRDHAPKTMNISLSHLLSD